MSLSRAAAVADAVLYEGYMLYPYRRSALKDRFPTLFGVTRPRAAQDETEPWRLGCELLIAAGATATLEGALRFLIPLDVSADRPAHELFELAIPAVSPSRIAEAPLEVPFAAGPPGRAVEGVVRIAAAEVAEGVYRLSLGVENRSPVTTDHGGGRFVSTQVLLSLEGAEFVPPRDPPAALAAAAAACVSEGLWPILLGEPGEARFLLCSPIILDDHPAVAPESTADLFDATEIDELLTLRIQTLSEVERREIERGDERVRALLARADATGPEDLARLHGTMRRTAQDRVTLTREAGGLAPGDRVRLRPRGRADIFDIALAGQLATVTSLETDLEGRRYVAVTVDDDPGRDLGALGKPGHRFFFGVDEVEPTGGT